MTLEQFFRENPSVGLGFSGGVDSSYLFYAALKFGALVKAYYVKTPFQPEFEMRDAKRLAENINAEITLLETDVLGNQQVASNPENRCYYCKTLIFGMIQRQAIADGISLIIDGTNASDDIADRPGMKALKELSVRSPLRECGVTKDEVRRLAKEAGLFVWNKPAYACLATRIPTGRTITGELLKRVENSEDALFNLGFSDFRARVMDKMDKAVKLQFKPEQMIMAIDRRLDIVTNIKPYFETVLLDLEGR